jgi:predicted regulator of Ras-like GTPase activity (Roadblock/LC7/MglB family)
MQAREAHLINQILRDLISSLTGAQAAIFLDGEGESIAQEGDVAVDMRLIGAWKEIQLDRLKEITNRLGLGNVHAVLFSLDEGTELVMPVGEDYCLLLFLSAFANIQDAMAGLKRSLDRLRKEIA